MLKSDKNDESLLSSSQLPGDGGTLINAEKERTYTFLMTLLLSNAIPLTIQLIATVAIFSISLHFIGTLEDTYLLDGVGVANTFINCVAVAVFVSLNVGLVAVSSQAFGANNLTLVGIYMHRGLVLNFMIYFVCCGFLSLTTFLFSAMSMPTQTANHAYNMITYSFGTIFSMMIYDTMVAYLMSQDIYAPQFMVQITICCLHWLWCHIFVIWLSLELVGLAIANTITFTTGVLLLAGYIIIKNPCPETWFWFKKDSFKELWSLLKTELAVGSTTYLEWIAFEFTLIFASAYKPEQLGGQVSFYNLLGIIAMVSFGLADTFNAVVAAAIGQQDIVKLKRLLKVGFGFNVFLIVIVGGILYFFKRDLIRFFTNDEEILDVAVSICDIYLVLLPGDFNQVLLGSYLRAIGKEKISSVCFLVCYYVLGLPCAYVFGNVIGWNVKGLWYGIGVGIYSVLIGSTLILLHTDFREQTNIIDKRITSDNNLLTNNGLKATQNDSKVEETSQIITLIGDEAENSK